MPLALSSRPTRPSVGDLRALRLMVLSLSVRFMREGFVVRALVWPGLLCSLSLVITAGAYAFFGTTPTIYVTDASWTERLEADSFDVRVVEDPETLLRDGEAVRAIWRDGETIVLGHALGGRATLIAESIVRELADSPWRIEVPELEARPEDVDTQAGMMAGIIGLLYTLYGVVMGAGSLYNDRSSGFVESELAFARPRWMPAASRVIALSGILVPGLAATLLLISALLPIDRVGTWIMHGGAAAATGGSLGLLLVSRGSIDKGFSAPLTRALMAAMALLGIGWMQPGWAYTLPICSLGAFMAGANPHGIAIVGAVAFMAAVIASTTRVDLI